jgi:hypothetical protein
MGEEYGKEEGIPIKKFLPRWDLYGRSAGFRRNKEMGDYADGLIALWDGTSHGTKQMIEYMRGLGKKVFVFKWTEDDRDTEMLERATGMQG